MRSFVSLIISIIKKYEHVNLRIDKKNYACGTTVRPTTKITYVFIDKKTFKKIIIVLVV